MLSLHESHFKVTLAAVVSLGTRRRPAMLKAGTSAAMEYPGQPNHCRHVSSQPLPQTSFTSQSQTEEDPSATNPTTSTHKSTLFPNSRAHLRPRSNVAPLYAHPPILPRLRDDVFSAADGNAPFDAKLSSLLNSMSKAADRGDVQTTYRIARQVAELLASLVEASSARVISTPFHILLKVLGHKGMVDACHDVLCDMDRCGASVTAATLNLVLRAAVRADDEEAIERTLDRLRSLRSDGEAAESHTVFSSIVQQDEVTEVLSYPIRNFTAGTVATLLEHCRAKRQPERALLLFATILREPQGPQRALTALMRSSAAENLIGLMLESRQYRLALEIAEWLQRVGGERLIPLSLWADIARESAKGGFHEGLLVGYDRAFSSGTSESHKSAPDEGFLLAALSTASTSSDPRTCLRLLRDFAGGVFAGSRDAEPCAFYTKPYPDRALDLFRQAHLAPLVDAYSNKGDFVAAIRLIGAIRTLWGKGSGTEISDEALGSRLEFAAKKDLTTLQQSLRAWTDVVFEARLAARALRQGKGQEKLALPNSAKQRNLADLKVIDRVVAGRKKLPLWYSSQCSQGALWMLDTVAMNSLIRAAARLGETDVALSIWRNARPRLYGGSSARDANGAQRSTLIGSRSDLFVGAARSDLTVEVQVRPNVETFNALLWACQTRRPLPAVQQGMGIFEQLRSLDQEEKIAAFDSHDIDSADSRPDQASGYRVSANSITYERLIVLLCSSATPGMTTSRHEADFYLTKAMKYLIMCREEDGLVPTRNTYEALIRATRTQDEASQGLVGRSSVAAGEANWTRLIREMEVEAGYEMSSGLKTWLEQELPFEETS